MRSVASTGGVIGTTFNGVGAGCVRTSGSDLKTTATPSDPPRLMGLDGLFAVA